MWRILCDSFVTFLETTNVLIEQDIELYILQL